MHRYHGTTSYYVNNVLISNFTKSAFCIWWCISFLPIRLYIFHSNFLIFDSKSICFEFRRHIFIYCPQFWCLVTYFRVILNFKKLYGPIVWPPFWGGSLLFTIKSPEICGTHFIDLGRVKGWVELGDTRWFRTRDPWIGNPAP